MQMFPSNLLQIALSVVVLVVAVQADPQGADGVDCNSNHGAMASDCLTLINNNINDNSQVSGDTNGRTGIVYGTCASVLHFGSGTEVTTKANLAQKAQSIYTACANGDPNLFFSGVLTGNGVGGDKYCLCNNNS
jgi:hypothetical protein